MSPFFCNRTIRPLVVKHPTWGKMDSVQGETSPSERRKSREDRAPHHRGFGIEYNSSFWDPPSKSNLFNLRFGLFFLI